MKAGSEGHEEYCWTSLAMINSHFSGCDGTEYRTGEMEKNIYHAIIAACAA